MKKKVLIGVGILVVALVLLVLSGGQQSPSQSNFSVPAVPEDESGVKGLKIN